MGTLGHVWARQGHAEAQRIGGAGRQFPRFGGSLGLASRAVRDFLTDVLDLIRDVLIASPFWAGVVSVVSAVLVYRAGVKNGERQVQADKQREDAALAREAQQLEHEAQTLATRSKREAYADFFQAVWEALSWIAVEDELNGSVGPPRAVPAEVMAKLARSTAQCTLQVEHSWLAQEVATVHAELVAAAAVHTSVGRGSLPALTEPIERRLPELREHLRADL